MLKCDLIWLVDDVVDKQRSICSEYKITTRERERDKYFNVFLADMIIWCVTCNRGKKHAWTMLHQRLAQIGKNIYRER